MSEIIGQPQISLKEQPTISCEVCGSEYFKEVTMLKKVSRLLTGSPNDTIVPFPTYMCDSCGYVNKDLRIFDDETPKIEE
jgi:uncharacterized Zn finger protein